MEEDRGRVTTNGNQALQPNSSNHHPAQGTCKPAVVVSVNTQETVRVFALTWPTSYTTSSEPPDGRQSCES